MTPEERDYVIPTIKSVLKKYAPQLVKDFEDLMKEKDTPARVPKEKHSPILYHKLNKLNEKD